MEQNLTLDPKKINTIKLRILELETENIVKKESNPAMEEKIRKINEILIEKYEIKYSTIVVFTKSSVISKFSF